MSRFRPALAMLVFFATSCFSRAVSVSNFAVEVSAVVQTNPPQISLSWPADTNSTSYAVYRKLLNDSSWGAIVTLAANATNFVDTNVTVGCAFEYQIQKSASSYSGEGDIYAGIQTPLVDYRGKVILLVDNTFSTNLATELERLQQELVGDGWTVLRHDVARTAVAPATTSSNVWAARSNELANIKAIITADYNADPANVNTVFIFGHIPVPYSGDISPDEHPNHVGAWPADVFYANLTGSWADSSVFDETASDTRNWNVPGDGKFDPSSLPSNVTLQVGRVDLANLTDFPQGETNLMRQYLNKDHNFRAKLTVPQRQGLIDDDLGLLSGEAPAVNGWRNFAPFFGASNIVASSAWFSTLATNSYLWGYGCGAGTYTSCAGVGSTANFVSNDPQVTFTMFFGSYFGDWDSPNDFLRAALATTNYTLTSAWVGRPYWFFHQMALGETIGLSTRVSQNNQSLYYSGNYNYMVQVALMGDPTLRMHAVAPPSALLVNTNGSGGVDLSWNASPDTVLGYHVYRAATSAGPFTRLTTNLLTGLNYTDPVVNSNVYMVRAVKLEVSGSGSYYNPSQGIFQSLDGSAGAPGITLFQPANNATFGVQAAIPISASAFDPANSITNVAFFANGSFIGAAHSPPYAMIWSNAPGGTYLVTGQASCANGQFAISSPVNVGVDNGGSPHLTIGAAGGGTNAIRGDDILGRTYHIQYCGSFPATNWQTLGTATANSSWTFQFLDPITSTQRFYRSLNP